MPEGNNQDEAKTRKDAIGVHKLDGNAGKKLYPRNHPTLALKWIQRAEKQWNQQSRGSKSKVGHDRRPQVIRRYWKT